MGSQAAASVTFLISLCLGSYYVSDGILTVGALLTFINLVNHLVYPLTELAGQWAGLQKSVSAMERIFKILEIELEFTGLPEAIHYKPTLSAIQFKDISFSYDGLKPVLINLICKFRRKGRRYCRFKRGRKTTLFHLLQGFYLPQAGTITINGQSTAARTVSEQRSLFAHVSQETVLFSGTVRENLQLAKPGMTDAQMIQAASIAGIHTFIASLPCGYDTEIGERGSRFSGGQRQRMAIARALLKDAPILLLDEGTSALDSETEYHVQKSMERLLYNRTTLVIAHRLSTIQNADLIVVMDEGKIVQMGRHEEIIRQDGLYRRLYRLQSEKGASSDDHSFDTRVV